MAYTYKHADGTQETYQDRKRYLWLLSPFLGALIPLGSIYFYVTGGQNSLWIIAPLIYFFGIIPALDALFGEDETNPPEAVISQLEQDNYYRIIAWLTIPVIYIVYIVGIWFIMSQGLPLWGQILFAVTLGIAKGPANNIGHELGHKSNALDRFGGVLALTAIGNGHFSIEHNRGHHTKVSTPEDCSSARMGETLYAFGRRDIMGALKGAWALEALRLSRKDKPVISHHNHLILSWGASALIALALAAWLGWAALGFILIYKFFAISVLTMANYVEHYGLLRQKRANGKYEPCAPRHSWNANHIFSNLLLINLQRHSDHHAYPMRPYQALRNFEDIPQLPSGYTGCFALAYFPPLWFKVMDAKVMAWAGGDITKVNIDPKAKEKLYQKYSSPA